MSAGYACTAHIAGTQVKEMIRLYKAGDTEAARVIDEELKPVVEALGVTINPIPVKAALNMLGHDVGGLRLPLVEATDEEQIEIRSGLERAGVLASVRV